MPKRMFNGDKAWRSDKLKQLPEPLAAEYAWMYPIALADGTFEADPHKVWSDAYSYNRKGFSPKKIAKILDDFEKCGLLLRTTGADGKVWGFWVGSETELPQETDTRKFKKGKKFLFDIAGFNPKEVCIQQDLIQNDAAGLVRFGLGKDRIGSENQTRAKGQYKKDEFSYLNNKPEKLYTTLVEKWSEAVGPGAVCKKPYGRAWSWFADTCGAVEADTLIPAFELWAEDHADQRDSPIPDFLRDLVKYTQRLVSVKAKPIDKAAETEREESIQRDIEESRATNAKSLEVNEMASQGESVEDLFARVEGS